MEHQAGPLLSGVLHVIMATGGFPRVVVHQFSFPLAFGSLADEADCTLQLQIE